MKKIVLVFAAMVLMVSIGNAAAEQDKGRQPKQKSVKKQRADKENIQGQDVDKQGKRSMAKVKQGQKAKRWKHIIQGKQARYGKRAKLGPAPSVGRRDGRPLSPGPVAPGQRPKWQRWGNSGGFDGGLGHGPVAGPGPFARGPMAQRPATRQPGPQGWWPMARQYQGAGRPGRPARGLALWGRYMIWRAMRKGQAVQAPSNRMERPEAEMPWQGPGRSVPRPPQARMDASKRGGPPSGDPGRPARTQPRRQVEPPTVGKE